MNYKDRLEYAVDYLSKREAVEIGAEADKEIEGLKTYIQLIKECDSQDKAFAVEEARLSIIIHSYAREGTFLDGADWAFVEISKQLEKRVAELLINNEEGE